MMKYLGFLVRIKNKLGNSCAMYFACKRSVSCRIVVRFLRHHRKNKEEMDNLAGDMDK